MQRINPDAATVEEQQFTEGSPEQGVPATVVTAQWLNGVQEELVKIIEDAGLELDSEDDTQLLRAVQQIAANQSRVETDYIDASAFTPTADGDAPTGTIEGATNGQKYPCRDFAHSADSSVQISYPMPENWDRGTVKAKLIWSPGSGASAGDDVVFILHGGAVSDGEALDMALTTGAGIADQASAEGNLQVSSASAALTIEGTPALGDMIHFRLTRDVSEGTTPMAATCRVIGLLIQYTCNQPVAAW